MRLNRRDLVVGAAAMAAVRPRPARAAEFSLKAGNNSPEDHPLTRRMREAAANVLRDSNGEVEIQIFPNSQLQSDSDALGRLVSGEMEIFSLSPLVLSLVVPHASVSGLGFVWSGYEKLWPAMDGELGAYVRHQIKRAGLYAFARPWENGFRQITSSTRPILTPDDLKGFMLRVPPGPLWEAMFRALGANTRTLNFVDLYSALRNRQADGQENPLALIEAAKLYEVQTHVSKTNHIWDGFWMLANASVWNSFPQDVRHIVETNFNAAAIGQRADVAKLNETIEATLSQKGMHIVDVETGRFRDRLRAAGFYEDWRARLGGEAWALMEKCTGSVS